MSKNAGQDNHPALKAISCLALCTHAVSSRFPPDSTAPSGRDASLTAILIWISLLAPWMRNQMHTAYLYQLHIFPLKLLFFLSIEGMIFVS